MNLLSLEGGLIFSSFIAIAMVLFGRIPVSKYLHRKFCLLAVSASFLGLLVDVALIRDIASFCLAFFGVGLILHTFIKLAEHEEVIQ
jgi:hypothetical protein